MAAAAYYNEIEPYAAAWLRNLIRQGLIAPGDVDERDIRDVQPQELRSYRQCHFFAGIGGWSLALRLAGWPDDREIWTGSCPCQPFSAAGKGEGFADERHLWPDWHWLVAQRRPAAILGEQVASAAAGPWLDLVQADLEGLGYAFGAVPVPAAGVGAPHIRDRLWWVADATGGRQREQRHALVTRQGGHADGGFKPVLADHCRDGDCCYNPNACDGVNCWLGHAGGAGLEGRDARAVGHEREAAERAGAAGGVADDVRDGPQRGEPAIPTERGRRPSDARGALSGFWADADWIWCRDGKARPVESGTFPLAHGIPARVGRLRAYGNAIVPQVAAEFIRAWRDLA